MVCILRRTSLLWLTTGQLGWVSEMCKYTKHSYFKSETLDQDQGAGIEQNEEEHEGGREGHHHHHQKKDESGSGDEETEKDKDDENDESLNRLASSDVQQKGGEPSLQDSVLIDDDITDFP